MKLYNTLNGQLENFKPINEGKMSMYVCGPTVYDYIHIGNARPVVFFDVVRRFFESAGYEVNYVSNVTDVDDKIINKALEVGQTEEEVTAKYLAQYNEDCRMLGAKPLTSQPKVTETMAEIIAYIEDLIAGGFAYNVDGNVYFRVETAPEYGKLSGRKVDDLMVGARVEANDEKENPLDFTLWKKTEAGVTWDSPWGKGRPGWHTECVVMIEEAFAGVIDIHGGGADLKFPHHENEIAQSRCGRDHPIANYWMHVGRLELGEEKMSKSIGNVVLVKDLLSEWDPNIFKLFLLSTHYRQPITFTYEALEASANEWVKITQTYGQVVRHLDLADALDITPTQTDKMAGLKADFTRAMEDDFNTANGLTAIYALLKELNILLRQKGSHAELAYGIEVLEQMTDILGLTLKKEKLSAADKAIFRKWQEARDVKDFETADTLRGALQEKGLI